MVARDRLEFALDRLLGASIKRRGGFVENQDGGVLQDRSSDRHALFFAARKLQAALADDSAVTIGRARDEVMDVGRARRCLDARLAIGQIEHLGSAVSDVVADAVVEQHGVLRHDADRAAQAVLRDAADVLAVDGDAAGVHIVEAEQQARERALARPRMADHRDRLACGNREIDIEQNLPLRRAAIGAFGDLVVAEIDMLEAHRAAMQGQRGRRRRIGHFAVLFEQREHLFHVGDALLDFAIDHAEEIERDVKLDHEGVHEHQIAQAHRAIDHA